MDYLKAAENDLNELKANEKSLKLLPTIIKNRKQKVFIINKALESMEEQERQILQRTCIDGVFPSDLEAEFKMSKRRIYILKNAALKKFTRLCYGIEILEDDNK